MTNLTSDEKADKDFYHLRIVEKCCLCLQNDTEDYEKQYSRD